MFCKPYVICSGCPFWIASLFLCQVDFLSIKTRKAFFFVLCLTETNLKKQMRPINKEIRNDILKTCSKSAGCHFYYSLFHILSQRANACAILFCTFSHFVSYSKEQLSFPRHMSKKGSPSEQHDQRTNARRCISFLLTSGIIFLLSLTWCTFSLG